MSTDVRVKGLSDLTTHLVAAGQDVQQLPVFAELAREAASAAARFAPRASGRLAAAIQPVIADNVAVVVVEGAAAVYAGAQNYGWRARGIRPTRFMQRADQAVFGRATSRIEDDIVKAMQREGLT